MDKNHAVDMAKARIKEITGKITGHERLEAEGKTDQAKVKFRQKVQSLRDRAEGIKDSFKHDRS
ncbi:CsbD family protein [Streptomyces sp. NPDC059534]|uniref:CsbD family protein n=1 Tax=Streptomyces sp. NPDC059534 TaxID=3346859 RepID=UPI0036C6529C